MFPGRACGRLGGRLKSIIPSYGIDLKEDADARRERPCHNAAGLRLDVSEPIRQATDLFGTGGAVMAIIAKNIDKRPRDPRPPGRPRSPGDR